MHTRDQNCTRCLALSILGQLTSSAASPLRLPSRLVAQAKPRTVSYTAVLSLYALQVCIYGYSVPIRRFILTQMVPMTHMTPKFTCLSL